MLIDLKSAILIRWFDLALYEFKEAIASEDVVIIMTNTVKNKMIFLKPELLVLIRIIIPEIKIKVASGINTYAASIVSHIFINPPFLLVVIVK